MERFGLSEIQAKAILDMQFRRLTGLEREKLENEYQELLLTIADLEDILANPSRVIQIIKEELLEIKGKYGDARRSEISDAEADMEDEDLIPVQNVVISLSANGYIKRMTTDNYRVQNRGGKGIKGMELNEDDVTDQFINMSTHDFLLVFTDTGKVFRIKGYNVPEHSRTSKGIPAVNLMQMDRNEKIKALVPYSNDDEVKYLTFVTKKGLVKRTKVEEFFNINKNGKIAIKLNEDDELAFVKGTHGDSEIIIAGSNGKAVRFKESLVRPAGRSARGVKGFNVDGGEVVGMATSTEGKYILTITENGYGKKSDINEFRITGRGTKGVKANNITEKTGKLVCLKAVDGEEDCMIMSDGGIIIRISLNQVPVHGRATQGVRIIKLKDDHKASTVAILEPEPEDATTETNEEEAE